MKRKRGKYLIRNIFLILSITKWFHSFHCRLSSLDRFTYESWGSVKALKARAFDLRWKLLHYSMIFRKKSFEVSIQRNIFIVYSMFGFIQRLQEETKIGIWATKKFQFWLKTFYSYWMLRYFLAKEKNWWISLLWEI